MTRHWSLRTRFMLAAVACLLPLLAVVAYVLYQSLEHSREQLIDVEVAVGNVVARGLEGALQETTDVLSNLSADDRIQRLEVAAAEEPLASAAQNRTNMRSLFLVDATGAVLTSSGSIDPEPLVASMEAAIQRSMLGETGVSPSITVRITDGEERVIAITQPVWSGEGDEGQPIAVLGALLSVRRLEQTLIPFGMGETAIAVVGMGGSIIASRASGLEDDLASGDQSATFAEPLAAGAAGIPGDFAYRDATGQQRLAISRPITFPGAEWTVLVTSPAPTTYGPNRSLLQNGILALAAAVVATLVLALVFGETIARPIRRLTTRASLIAQGDFSQQLMGSDETIGADEVGRLRVAFQEMATRLSEQVGDLEASRRERELQADELRELNRRTVRLQENERRRIAAEIHDAVAPLITGALYQARALRMGNGATPAAERDEGLGAVGDLLARASEELHGVIFDLRPPDLDDLGVVAAIERYMTNIQRSGLTCSLAVDGDVPNLTPEVRLGIYRIVQEALHNVLRHAAADEAIVRLEVQPDHHGHDACLRVTIRDNGAGFDPERAIRPTSLGLLSMRERAAAIGGSFAIDSTPGLGTTVTIERPLGGEPMDGSDRQGVDGRDATWPVGRIETTGSGVVTGRLGKPMVA
ncbi:MAG: cache domain-containing protein [Thermomicrobiales bacterium]